jgi:hypothetical protein
MNSIDAAGFVPATPERVFEFLAALENHWELADRFIDVLELDRPPADAPGAQGGRVQMQGPLGLSRTATTRVLAADPPREMRGTADVGRGTRARVTWSLAPTGTGTWVSLSARVESASPLDRALLALGGRLWLRRRFSAVIGRLHERFAAAGSGRRPSQWTAASPTRTFAPASSPAPSP